MFSQKSVMEMSRSRGSLFFSAMLLLLLAGSLITGEIVYYKAAASSYIEIIQQNEAQAIKNLAVSQNLDDGKQLRCNLGTANRLKEQCLVDLGGRKKFNFTVTQWQK